MNTRRVIKIEENEQNFIFYKMSEENEKIFRNYIEMSRHFQEITQLYRMMLFDLDDISKQYVFHFDDRVIPLYDKELNILYVNRIIRNAVSSARTLIESMEIFEREYIDSEGYFKINFISRTYDEYFSYRFIDFIRNYLQHGHVPISFDGEKIFFQLSEILDVTHMRINSSLKKQMKNIEHELLDYGDGNIYLTVVPMCYEYFLLVQVLILAEKLEQERNAFLEKRYDNHGTNVNCFEMNVAVEQLNVDLLYFAVLEKECNKLEEYDEKVKELLAPLKECGPYIIWDDLDRSIQIAKNIPKSFCEKDLELIWQCVKEVDERVLVEANKLENER